MNWMNKLHVLQCWHGQSEKKQQLLVKNYLLTHPGISSSDDWIRYLAEVFGIVSGEQGYLDLDSLVH